MIAGSLTIEMNANIARLASDMHQAKGMVGGVVKSMESAVGSLKTILGTLGAGLSVAVIVNKIDSVIDGMEKLQDASEKTGASVENLSKLQFFAGISGSNIDSVTTALAKLSKGMADTGKEGAPTSQALKFLGLSAKDAAGNLKDPSALFTEISQKLIAYQDGAGKAAIAQALFGKAGAELLPTLKKMAELGDIEASVTTAQAQAAENYGTAVGRLTRQKDALWNTVVSALIPSMQSFVELMTDASKQTDSMGASARGLASDGSIESWADKGVMAVAILIDAIKFIPKLLDAVSSSFQVVGNDINVLSKAATLANPSTAAAAILQGKNPLQELKVAYRERDVAMANAGVAYGKLLDKEVGATQIAMAKIISARKANAIDAARDMEGASREAAPLKPLNFAMLDTKAGAKLAAAELKLYQGAVKGLENQLGDLNNETETQKLAFAMYGKEMTLADGTVIHLTGSLETLRTARKNVLSIFAAEIDARKALKAIGDESAKIQAEIDALEKYSAAALLAREATGQLYSEKASSGPAMSLTSDVAALGNYTSAAAEANEAGEIFRSGKAESGAVTRLGDDLDAMAEYADAAVRARAASLSFTIDKMKAGQTVDLQPDVMELGNYAAAVAAADQAGVVFRAGKGKAGEVVPLQVDVAAFEQYADAAATARQASQSFGGSKTKVASADLRDDVTEYGRYVAAAAQASQAGELFQISKGKAGQVATLVPDMVAFGSYAEAAGKALVAEGEFREGKGKGGAVASFVGDVGAFVAYADAAEFARVASLALQRETGRVESGADLQQDVAEFARYAAAAGSALDAQASFLDGKGGAGKVASFDADVGAFSEYARAAAMAGNAGDAFLNSKGGSGDTLSLGADVSAFATYAESADSARRAGEVFRTDKGKTGSAANFDADADALAKYRDAAESARLASTAFARDIGKVVPGADLQSDVAEFSKYIDAARQAQEAGAMFQDDKGKSGQVASFLPDEEAFESFGQAAQSARIAEETFRADKGKTGQVVMLQTDVDAFGEYAGAAAAARGASLSFISSKGSGPTADLQPDVAQFGKYADAVASATAADASFKTGKATPGMTTALQAEIAAFAKYSDAAAHAKETLARFETEKGKDKGLGASVKAQLIEEAQASDLLAMKKNLLTESSKNYADALKTELTAQLQLSMGAAAATAYGDAIVKLQSGQLAALDADKQRAFMLSALSKAIADANMQTARETTTLKENAEAIALDIELLGQDRFATQYAAEAKMRLALANKLVDKSYADSAIAAAKNLDALNKIKDAANLGTMIEDKTKQLNIDMILDDRQRAKAQIQVETAKFRQQIDLYERAYEHMASIATDSTIEQLAAQRKVVDNAKQALNDYTKAIGDKQVVEEFKEIWSTVESTGKQVFVNVFSDGKNAFEGIGKAIKASVIDLLYQLTVKKWIIQIGTSFTDSMGLTTAANAAGGTGGGGMGGMLNLAGSGISKAFGGSGSLMTDAAGAFGFGGGAALGGTALAGEAAALGVGSLYGGAAAGAGAAAGGAAVAGGAAAGVGAAAAIPYVGWAIAAYALLSGMDEERGPKPSQIGLFGAPGGYYNIGQQDTPGGEANVPMYDQIEALINDPKKYDQDMLDQYTEQWMSGSPDEGAQSMVEKLLKALVPAAESAAQKNAKEAEDAAAKAAEEAAALAALTQAEDDRIAAINSAIEVLRTSYRREADEFAQMAAKWHDAAAGLRAYGASLLGIGSRGMTYAVAASKFAITAAQSRAGDMGAMESLQEVSENFRNASLANSASQLAYARDVARIQSAVGDSAIFAERQEVTALIQRDIMEKQVESLIDIKEAVVSVDEAIGLLQGQIEQLRTTTDSSGKHSKRTADILEAVAHGNLTLSTEVA